MSNLPISGNFSDTEDDVVEDEDEELRFQESIKKDLFTEFTSATPMKMARVSVAHAREPMKVYLRVRPFTNIEIQDGESQECMDQENRTTLLMRAPKNSFAFKSSQRGFGEMNHKFTFSNIFDEDTSQKVFFDDTMLATVKDVIDGHNCLVFTYGVTNAGKTYTIQGVPQDGGILPRSLDVIFNSIENRQYFSNRVKPRYFCDVVKLSEKQQKKEEDVKSKLLALGNVPSTGAADQTTMLEGESMMEDSLNTDLSRASYSASNDDTQDSSKLSESKMSTTKDFEALSNQTFLDEVNARIPDDTVVNVDAQGPVKFSIWISFAEIYNEYMYDLLEPLPKEKKIRRQALKLAEDKNGSIYIKGLKQIQVNNADEAYRVLKIGQRNLSIAATKLNHCSSRSHCIFSIKILRVVDVDDPHVARVSHLSFCDLAGSERYTRTQNTGDRLKEAGNINTSLLTLGKCIHALRYNQNHPKVHPKIIPFRESKLTRLFQSFFLGKGKASMVVNVNQCASGFDETMHVLKFSAIAKQVTTVTSKLDNKWKEPPAKKAKRPLRNVSLALNQALDCKVKGQRPSVPWATPGTIAQVMKETGHVASIEDTVFEEDEEEEEEEEEEEDSESDVADTPVAKKNENTSKIQKELMAVIDILKQKLVDEKSEKFYLETKIREEVCQEMADQLVEIEQDYNERLEEDKQRAEEVYEKRLEIYAKSVKKTRKRERNDGDAASDAAEQVSISLLAAEQNKVRDRNAQIEKLTSDLESTENSLRDFEDRMHNEATELNKTIADQKKCIAENESKVSSREKEFTDSKEALQNMIDELKRTIVEQKHRLVEQERDINSHEKEEMGDKESLQEQISELNKTVANQKKCLEEKEAWFSCREKELTESKDALQKQVEELSQTISEEREKGREIMENNETILEQMEELNQTGRENKEAFTQMEKKVSSRAKEEKEVKEALQKQICELNQTIADLNDCLNEKESEISSQEKEISDTNETVQKQICELNQLIADQNNCLKEEKTKIDAQEKRISDIKETLQKQIVDLTQTIKEQKEKLVDRETEISAHEKEQVEGKDSLQKEISELKRTIADLEKSLEEEEAKSSTQEKLRLESKETLQKQIDDLNKITVEQKQKLAERETEISTHEKKQVEGKEALQEQIEELKTVVDVQKDQLCKKTDRIDTLERELEVRQIVLAEKVGELTTVIENQQAEIKKQAEGLELKTKQMQESTSLQHKDLEEHDTLVSDLEERIEVLAGAEKQLADAKKEMDEQEIQIADLYKQLEEREAKVKETGETMAAELCAEIKMHEEAQKEMRNSILKKTQNETEAKKLIEDQEASNEELKAIVETKERQIEELEETLSSRDEEIKEMEAKLETSSRKASVEESETQTEMEYSSENFTSSSSSEESAGQELSRKKMSGMPSTTSLASTISTTSTEEDDDDSIIIIEPEDQAGYKAGRLSRVEIDATPLQKKNSRKGRAAKITKTSLRSSRKRGGGGDDDQEESSKKLRGDDGVGVKPKGRARRATRASSKTSLNEEIENQPEDGTSPSATSLSGSSQRRGPLARINEYLQNSPIGKSVYDTAPSSSLACTSTGAAIGAASPSAEVTPSSPPSHTNLMVKSLACTVNLTPSVILPAKRLVDTATAAASPSSAEVVKPPSPSPPKAVEMATFVPSMVPERQKRKRKLYKTDISAPFEASPHEMISRQYVGEAKSTEGAVTVITRKLRSRAKKY
ncbi:kinesin-like protein KIF20B isoform X3 [Strongylocentrotus purpuratus]|uniref:Kinesin motor domain-containing protein n=1 Tax=Strongylocentrotus purpuratus TaxID=7668 RepID=A0A7M7NWY3_STRPU|nr:kinesin-like protein KIF20B isoform X3 [Strongylocentrotus purpuratus]